jgi:hypothetical protein
MQTIIDNWPLILAAAIPAIEVFIGALPNNLVPYRSYILKILGAIDKK